MPNDEIRHLGRRRAGPMLLAKNSASHCQEHVSCDCVKPLTSERIGLDSGRVVTSF
jgi:hypothetical protein